VNDIVIWGGGGGIYIYKLVQQHYELDGICFPGESMLHLPRREGIVGSPKVACLYVWVGFLNIKYLTTLGLDEAGEHIAMGFICSE